MHVDPRRPQLTRTKEKGKKTQLQGPAATAMSEVSPSTRERRRRRTPTRSTLKAGQNVAPRHLAVTAIKEWCQSDEWLDSAMQHNSWAALPIPALDKVFRGLLVWDLKNCAMTCKSWCDAATAKIPYSAELIKQDREMWRERRKLRLDRESMNRRIAASDWRQARRAFGIIMAPSLPCLAMGLTGVIHFHWLFDSISVVPECASSRSMAAALYCCCAFWLFGFVLFFLATLSAFNVDPYGSQAGMLRRVLTFENVFRCCNAAAVVAASGAWSSAAATVHFAKSCIDLYSVISFAARFFGAVSLSFGLAMSVLCAWFEIRMFR